MSKTFNQLISSYTKADRIGGTFKMKTAGCGTCALASVACNKHAGLTNIDVAKYMVDQGFTRHDGTTRDGMTKAIAHYGMKSTYYSPAYSGTKFDDLMKGIKKTGYGILLMYGHTGHREAKNDYWTHHGHFISITSYDANKGFYVRDSANGRTGWHTKSAFAGCIVAGWVLTDVEHKKSTVATVKTEATTVEKAKEITYSATVNTGSSNLMVRNSAGSAIGKLTPGKKVTVTKKNATTMKVNGTNCVMAKIKFNSATGYVSQRYLKF